MNCLNENQYFYPALMNWCRIYSLDNKVRHMPPCASKERDTQKKKT